MTPAPLTVGMLGYRFMGRAHVNALNTLPVMFPEVPKTELDVIVGRDEAALAEAAERFGFRRYATEWKDIVEEVDVFYNLGPNSLHVEPSISALEAGTNVFCEKPLAHTREAAERMRDAAAGSEATAGVAFNYRFVPALRYAKELIEAGELGEIHHVRGQYLQDWLLDPEAAWSWRNDESVAGSGALGDLGAHTIDLIRFLAGERTGPITAVSGQLQTFVDERPVEGSDERKPVTVDDAYTAQVAFENGATGTLEASRCSAGSKNDHTIEIDGSKGSIRFSLERLNELEVLRSDARGYETILITDEDDPYIDHWWPPGHIIGWEHTFVHENAEFLTAAANGEPFSPSFEEGYLVQELLDAIQRSDHRGEWIEI